MNPTFKNDLVLYTESVQCGFPSPAENFMEREINLNDELIYNKTATFLIRVTGDSMVGVGIYPNDIVLIDTSLPLKNKSIVLAMIDGEFTLKRFLKDKQGIYLKAENPNYPDIFISKNTNFEIRGIATYVIHNLR